MLSFYKKFVGLTLIFALMSSFLAPIIPAVFAADDTFCNEVLKATCDSDLKSLSGDSRLENCSDNVKLELSNLIKQCTDEIKSKEAQINSEYQTLKKEENTAESILGKLNWNIKKLNTEIASLNITIAQLDNAIQEREKAIKELNDALESQQQNLAVIIRQIYEYDSNSYVEIILGSENLSDFSDKLIRLEALQAGLQKSVGEIRKAKEQMEKEKKELEQKKAEQEQYKKTQEISKQSLALKQEQQQYLLQQLAVAKTPLEKEMARIKTELMELENAMSRLQKYLGGWLLYQPSWSEIFAIIENVSPITGVRRALLLAILQMESRFKPGAGYNAGSPEGNLQRCLDYRIDDTLCYKQKPIFEEICAELGLDKNKVPISATYAMGPSQIIPTTWRGYQRKYPVRNPWSLNDAVLLMGYILRDNGAASGNERGAVYAYNHSSDYVNAVMETAQAWQEVIDICGGLNLNCPNLKERLEKKFSEIPIK